MSKFEFICGSAGTGKTFLARQRLNDITRGCVLTATTGIAAVNLGDATTINSLLKYYDTKSLRENYENGELDIRLGELSIGMDIKEILVDEVSMMDGDQLDIICAALDFHNITAKDPISLTLLGDFCQLAPVKASFAFEAKMWPRFEQNTQKLTRVYRQSDANFIDALLAARRGNGAEAAEYFVDRFHNTLDIDFDGTTIMSKNDEVNIFNAQRLAKIESPIINFYAIKSGKMLSEWKNIPDTLEVKSGALVMLLSNEYIGYGEDQELLYVNGDLAYFLGKLGPNAAEVRLVRNGECVVVNRIERQNTKVKKGKSELVGSVKYLPIRLAFASTVHKSQGLTLDRAQINMKHPFVKFPGMLYVALSRARTSAGLRLVGTPKLMAKRCRTDPRVERWL